MYVQKETQEIEVQDFKGSIKDTGATKTELCMVKKRSNITEQGHVCMFCKVILIVS